MSSGFEEEFEERMEEDDDWAVSTKVAVVVVAAEAFEADFIWLFPAKSRELVRDTDNFCPPRPISFPVELRLVFLILFELSISIGLEFVNECETMFIGVDNFPFSFDDTSSLSSGLF